MKKNMGIADRLIRAVLAAVVVGLFLTHVITGTLEIVLLAIAGIFVLISFVSVCPLYSIVGINTCKTKA